MEKKFHPYPLRFKLGLTLKTFGNIIHCGVSNLAMIEGGKRKLSMKSSMLTDYLQLAHIDAQKSGNEKSEAEGIIKPFLAQQIKLVEIRIEKLKLILEKTQLSADALLLFIKTAEEFKKNSLPPELQDSITLVEILQRKGIKKHKHLLIKICKIKMRIAGLYGEIKNAEKQKETLSK